jgi:hypothetical protein
VSSAGTAQPALMAEPLVSVAQRTHQFYDEEGRQDGDALKYWLKAKREIQKG